MKTRVTMTEGRRFPDFYHYRGKIQQKSVAFSFRITCNKDKPHRVHIRRRNESILVNGMPEYKFNDISSVLRWIVDHFSELSQLKTK